MQPQLLKRDTHSTHTYTQTPRKRHRNECGIVTLFHPPFLSFRVCENIKFVDFFLFLFFCVFDGVVWFRSYFFLLSFELRLSHRTISYNGRGVYEGVHLLLSWDFQTYTFLRPPQPTPSLTLRTKRKELMCAARVYECTIKNKIKWNQTSKQTNKQWKSKVWMGTFRAKSISVAFTFAFILNIIFTVVTDFCTAHTYTHVHTLICI